MSETIGTEFRGEHGSAAILVRYTYDWRPNGYMVAYTSNGGEGMHDEPTYNMASAWAREYVKTGSHRKAGEAVDVVEKEGR